MAEAPEATDWDPEAFDNALDLARDGVIEASLRRVSSEQLARLLAAAPRDQSDSGARLTEVDFTDATLTGDASFDGATFDCEADFREATFSGEASFGEANFTGDALFNGATFTGNADLRAASFGGDAEFMGAKFSGDADLAQVAIGGNAQFNMATFDGWTKFGGAAIGGEANFHRARFSGRYTDFEYTRFSAAAIFLEAKFSARYTSFERALFSAYANFYAAEFAGDTRFDSATFDADASFERAAFGDEATFTEATWKQDASFRLATFEHAKVFGPVHVFDRLWLDEAVFAQRVTIEASASRASFARAAFREGADLRVRWAELWLEDSDFAQPSLITGLPARLTPEGGKAFLGWEKPEDDGAWQCVAGDPPEGFAPHVLSARGARVASLTLSGVNLERCRFAGAHGLDQLRLERVELPHTPEAWRWSRRQPVPWSRRRTIAEEHEWRTQRRCESGWVLQDNEPNRRPMPDSGQSDRPRPPWPPEKPGSLEAEQIAGLYRELRKGREDSKDAPGANDFYYGEMEMRRHSDAPLGERAILWFYWLASGYGLRASRALLALAATITVLAVPLYLWGFRVDRPYGRALLFSIESSISLLRAPEARLTASGEVIQIVLRLAGPLFFGLALLALRGRVKR